MTNDFTPGRPLRTYDEHGFWRDHSTDDIVGQKLNGYKGWLCGIGSMNLHVNMDGDVYGASCKVGGKLGNVYTDVTIPSGWTVCTRNLCSCGADLFIPKARSADFLPLLRRTNGVETHPEKRSDVMLSHAAVERTHASDRKQIYWEIGRRCNFDCSYCWPWIHNNHERHKSLEELVRATQLLEDRFVKGEKVNFIISGGEPTANPAFLDWVRYINSFGHHLSMHSNGTRKPDYYQELIQYGDLNLSAHYEFWKQDHFLSVVRAVTKRKIERENIGVGHLEVKLMMAPGTRSITLDTEEKMRAIPGFSDYCTWAIVPIRDGKMGDQIIEGYANEDFMLFGDRR